MSRARLAPAAIVLLALGLRLAYLAEAHGSPFFLALGLDAKYYDDEALRILSGTLPREPFFMGPLYSYFLAALYAVFGHAYDAVRVAQALLGAATALVAWGIGSRIAGRTAAFLAGALVAIYPPLIFYTGSILYPTLAAFLDAAAVWLLIEHARTRRPRDLALAGFAFGLSAVGQATTLAALPGVLLWIFFLERRSLSRAWRRAMPLLAGAAVAIAPLTAHNVFHGGEPVFLTSNGGLNFYIGNGREATGGYVKPKGLDVYEDPSGREMLSRREGRRLSARETDRIWMRAGLDDVRERPGRFASLLLRKTALYWGAIEIPQIESFEFQKRASRVVTALDALPISFGLLGPLCGLGAAILLARARRRPALAALVAPPLVVAAVYSATIVLFFVISRYRLPMLPILLPFAACALVEGGRLAREAAARRARIPLRPALGAALLLVLLSLAVNANPYRVSKTSGFGQVHFRLGVIARQNGKLDEAEKEYREAIAFEPDYAPSRMNLAELLLARGETAEAGAELERAVRIDPDYWRAHYNLGLASARLNDWAGASEQFDAAARLAPAAPDAWFGIGIARFHDGDWARAREAFERMAAAAAGAPEPAARARALAGLAVRAERLESAAGPPGAGGGGERDGAAARASARAGALWAAVGENAFALQEFQRVERNSDPVVRFHQGVFLVSGADANARGTEARPLSELDGRDGRALLEEALAARPGLPYAHFYLGAAALKRKDFDTALREFAAETETNPDNAEAFYNAGVLYLEHEKDPAAAARAFSACAALGREKSAESREILRRLGAS